MEIRPHRIIKRKKTRKINVGNLYIGGDAPDSSSINDKYSYL